jgi:hypothetical protein
VRGPDGRSGPAYCEVMIDDRDLTDEALREEIELVGELVVAATASTGRMGQAEVDQLLGVRVA